MEERNVLMTKAGNHEVRGYLQSILANIELLKRENAHQFTFQAVHYLDKIEWNCRAIEDCISKNLKVARSGSSETKLLGVTGRQ